MDEEIIVKEEPGLCRCCHSEGCFKDINQEYVWMDENEVYGDILEETFGIKISVYGSRNGINGSRKLICKYCIMRLREACTLRKQVLANEKKLAEMLGPEESEHAKALDAAVTVKAERSEFEDIKVEEHGVSRPNLTNPVAAVTDEVKVKAELLKSENVEDFERPGFSYNPIIHSIKRFGSLHEDEVEGGTHHSDAVRALSLSGQAARSARRGGHKPTVMHGKNTPRSMGRGMHNEIAVKRIASGKNAAAESSGKRKRFIL